MNWVEASVASKDENPLGRFRHLALAPGYEANEVREIKEQRWKETLEELMREAGKSLEDIASDSAEAPWKIAMAARLRQGAVPYRWIGEALIMTAPSAIRGRVFRFREHRTALSVSRE